MPATSRPSAPLPATFTIYAAGFAQGCAFVLIPALGTILKTAPYRLSDAAYGTLFLPETLGALIGAVLAGRIAQRFGLVGLLRFGLLANIAALAFLIAGALAGGSVVTFALFLLETACLGAGFGLTLAAVNDAATLLFPAGASAAVTVLNAVIGGGTAISPLILAAVTAHTAWWAWPVALLLVFVGAAALSGSLSEVPGTAARTASEARMPARLWWYAGIVVIYAICEGTFGSWASIFVHTDRGGTAAQGAFALSAFWGAMTLARIGFGSATKWLPPKRIYAYSPLAIALVFVTVPLMHGAGALILLFALAGVACSYFFPFSMAFAIEENPAQRAAASGLLVAALMAGEGIGSYALGPLQSAHVLTLGAIYRTSALWGVLLFPAAWWILRTKQHNAVAPA
ncbi:MAG: MFS transporter [Vulcanimicrobiaceae bacterium]